MEGASDALRRSPANHFDFEPDFATRVPRGWDRVPKSPFHSRRKGQKVWKRHVSQQIYGSDSKSDLLVTGDDFTAEHVVKRQCLKNMPAIPAKFNKQRQYMSTLRDQILGTPKRKSTRLKSLRATIALGPQKSYSSIAKGLPSLHTEVTTESLETSPQLPWSSAWEDADEETPQVPLDNTKNESHTIKIREQKHELESSKDENKNVLDSTITANECRDRELVTNDVLSEENGRSVSAISLSPAIPIPRRTSKRLSSLSAPKGDTTVQLLTTATQPEAKRVQSDGSTGSSASTTRSDDQSCGQSSVGCLDELPSQELGHTMVQEETSSAISQLESASTEFPEASESVEASVLEKAVLSEGDEATAEEVKVGIESFNEKVTHEGRRSRLLSRVSDDTDMLKDFISRAQAKKAARALEGTNPIYSSMSPRRSPRKVLGNLDSNSPSPTKPVDLATRPGTPQDKSTPSTLDNGVDLDETIADDSAPHRRSARTRASVPSKTTIEAPCFIPVRRPDGSELVVLQKSAAQDLAIVTRTNTRRNKGQAKMPKIMLETMIGTEGDEELLTKRQDVRHGKSVDWDQRLVYYQDSNEEKTNKLEKPRVRRLRGLGATNGTPAPKRTMLHDVGLGEGGGTERKQRVKGTARSTPRKRAKA